MIRRVLDGFAHRRRAALAQLTLTYAVFAGAATVLNLGVQRGVAHLAAWLSPWTGELVRTTAAALHLTPARLLLAPELVAGTAAGLVFKYLLDKRFIFRDRQGGGAAHVRKFGLYAVMGLATTVIFWAAELGTAALTPDPRAPYVGGAIGLMLGYFIKYRLDRRFVFVEASVQAIAQGRAELKAGAPAG